MNTQEMIEAIKSNYPPEKYSELRESLDHCLTLLKAKSEGRLLILPCKVGTRVYIKYCQFIPVCCDRCISGHGFDSDCDYFETSQEHCSMELQHDKFGRTMGIASKRFTYDMITQFGKTVFLTREEAEEALKKESET